MGRRLRVAVTLEQCWHRVPGGTARATLESVAALDRRGDVELVGVAARHSHPPAPAWRPPIPVEHLPLPRPLLYESWHYLRRPRVDRATGDVDVVHVTGMAMPPPSAPLVVTVHDLDFVHDPSHVTRHGLRFFRRAIELTRRDATIVVAPSTATIDDCADHGFDRGRLRLVPWGVHKVDVDEATVNRVRQRYGLARRYVLFVGTIEPRKNLPRLVEAFAKADPPDTDLVLAGAQGWNEELDRLIAPARSRVKVTGFVEPADLAPLYRGAALFCLPSLREGFGLPVLEAMVQGTPVVTARGTSTEEVAGDAALLVEPTDAGAIAEAIRAVLDDPSLAADLGRRGAERASGYTWERTAELLVAAFGEAVA